jgi:16S rRNA (guanine966-N2)-methyltransferase
MIRISGGQFRSRQIQCPKGKDVRPTTSFVRESLFNILGPKIVEARFLDLFAGCGIVGLEALSRGASFVEAVELSSRHCQILDKNRTFLNIQPEQYQITCADAFDWVRQQAGSEQYDIIFMDPPYALEGVFKVIQACFQNSLLVPGGLLVWESNQKAPKLPEGAMLVDTRTYGESTLRFLTYSTQ